MPAVAKYFVDENMLAVGRALALVRDDVVHPGHALLPEVPRGALDPEWLPLVGDRRLVVITRDLHLRRKPGERRLLRQHAVRMFVITGKRDLSKWGKLELVVRSWRGMEDAIARHGEGPWVMGMTEGGLSELPLGPAR